ncbi:C45 family autoproteolytic acyltransferase/hydolase [Sulfitobacter sp. PS-8MA]|uniref:C45 family autoproteolytic acyltransferase/hydolase n=1 Tax=Sulfitobacter sp. PS-8MA TaxID=3237707 RepID=UPI0034C5F5C0
MQVVDCFGTPSERGEMHGESLRSGIAEALSHWETATMQALANRAPADFDTYCADFVENTALMARAAKTAPTLYDELVGIAKGAGQPLQRIAAYNLMDEQWWYDALPTAPPPGCSLVAAPVAEGHVLAQNMDLPAHMEGSQVALRLAGPDIPQQIVLSAAGLIGLTGVNDAGLAVGVNTLLMLNHASDGLPVAFVTRSALAARDAPDARQRLMTMPHASGQHFALVARDGITSLEGAAGGTAPVPVSEGALLHTNHPLVHTGVDPAAQTRLTKSGFNRSSATRLDWLQQNRARLHDAASIQTLFDDDTAPICMHTNTNGGSSTFASVLYEMTESTSVRMRKGIAGSADWQQIRFDANYQPVTG